MLVGDPQNGGDLPVAPAEAVLQPEHISNLAACRCDARALDGGSEDVGGADILMLQAPSILRVSRDFAKFRRRPFKPKDVHRTGGTRRGPPGKKTKMERWIAVMAAGAAGGWWVSRLISQVGEDLGSRLSTVEAKLDLLITGLNIQVSVKE